MELVPEKSALKRGGEAMEKFYWGTAVSSYQVEGEIENNDWAEAGRKGKVPLAGRACDFWNRYELYLDYAKSLGTNAFRFSIEWARVEPQEGKWDREAIGHYLEMIKAMRDRNLEPFVTLWHFTLPSWVAAKGGWVNRRTVEFFKRYVQRMVKEIGENVRYWIIINEPSIALAHGYLQGTWPPHLKFALLKYSKARSNLKRAVLETAEFLHGENPNYNVGSAFNLSFVEAARPRNPGDMLAVLFIQRFDDSGFMAEVANALDFIGLNYYMRLRLRFQLLPFPKIKSWVPADKVTSDLGWEVFPEGLKIILMQLSSQFDKPIIVTENGIADSSDKLRPEFIKEHIEALMSAKHRGADIRGYFYWSLLDNFEWAYGFAPRFGLYALDPETLELEERKSAAVYRALISAYSRS
jgi:beta-glucosidase